MHAWVHKMKKHTFLACWRSSSVTEEIDMFFQVAAICLNISSPLFSDFNNFISPERCAKILSSN